MKIITPDSRERSSDHDEIFAQGAACIAHDEPLLAGLWCNNTPHYEGQPIGTIGACRIDDSAKSTDFLSACADYLHSECQSHTVVGPMNGNTWLRHRLVLESDGRDPFLMEPIEPAHYPATFEAAGFSILSRYSSSLVDLDAGQDDFSTLEQRMDRRGVKIRPLDMDRFEEDLMAIFKLSLISFSNNFLYTPLSQEMFLGKYQSSREHIDPDLVLLAERDGELAGFVFCTPDLLARQYGKDPAIIVKTLAALPDRILFGLGTVLVSRVQQAAKGKGYREAIHALQYESNTSLRISQRFSAKIFRRYALMAKHFR